MLIAGCDGVVNPVSSPSLIIKSLSKWKVDTLSDVKLSRVMYKEFDISGNVIIQEDFSDDGIIISKSTYSYETNVGVEFKSTFDETGEKKSEKKVEYEYDKNRRVIRQTNYNTNGSVENVFTFTYDEFGNVIKRTMTNGSSVDDNLNIDYSYSQTGELIEKVTKNDAGNLSRDSISYISTLRVVNIFKFNSQGLLTNIITYHYNSLGNITEEYIYTGERKLLKKFIYEYVFF
ncbi:MAG: RHS repeat protein [Candidatus Kapabacteria bacterium]|nr:RHS repeat protein [Candidatus Kapabacteria bacterium]